MFLIVFSWIHEQWVEGVYVFLKRILFCFVLFVIVFVFSGPWFRVLTDFRVKHKYLSDKYGGIGQGKKNQDEKGPVDPTGEEGRHGLTGKGNF